MKRAILFNGLIRRPEVFHATLETLGSLAASERPRIIFSTWRDELDKHPELRERLRALDATIVEQSQPNIILTGHMLHQVVSLDGALSVLDDDAFVLKGRPDYGLGWTLRAFLAAAPERLSPGTSRASVLSHRLLIIGAQVANPLYFNDMIFAGMASDMRQLVRVPFVLGTRYANLAPEQWLWVAPFATECAALDAYFRVNVGMIFNDEDRARALARILAGSRLYARAIAAGLEIFRCNFGFLADPQRVAAREAARQCSLEDLLWGTPELPAYNHHPTAHVNIYLSAGAIEAMGAADYRRSEFGDRMAATVAAIGSGTADDGTFAKSVRFQDEAAELARNLEDSLQLAGLKHLRESAGVLSFAGADPQWTFGQLGTEATEKLERDNNHLRRTVDQLNARIRTMEKNSRERG